MGLEQFEVSVRVGDIAAEAVDAVVNAANAELWMGSGVAGSLKRSGGQIIEDEVIVRGPILPGQAVATSAGKLPAQWVIHAVAIDRDMKATPQLVHDATLSALQLAEEMGLASIALPALGAGVGGLTLPKVAQAMRCGVEDFATQRTSCNICRIGFVLYDVSSYNTFRQVFFTGGSS